MLRTIKGTDAVAVNRRSFIVGLGAGLCCLGTGAAPILGEPVLTVVHCGDPQLGFGQERPDPYVADLARFEKVIARIDAIKPDAVAICGDMVNVWQQQLQDWPRLVKKIKQPLFVAPGNHDMGGDPIKPMALDLFNEAYGADHRSQVVKGWKFIVANTQYVFKCNKGPAQREHDAWLKAELASGKAAGQPMILVTHVPPYAQKLEERDGYYNYPKATRVATLDQYVSCGLRFHLAGHLHRTAQRTYKGLPILNAETTCNNFDKRPFGFRLLKVYADNRYTWEFVAI